MISGKNSLYMTAVKLIIYFWECIIPDSPPDLYSLLFALVSLLRYEGYSIKWRVATMFQCTYGTLSENINNNLYKMKYTLDQSILFHFIQILPSTISRITNRGVCLLYGTTHKHSSSTRRNVIKSFVFEKWRTALTS
jgi:hypothetical protein